MLVIVTSLWHWRANQQKSRWIHFCMFGFIASFLLINFPSYWTLLLPVNVFELTFKIILSCLFYMSDHSYISLLNTKFKIPPYNCIYFVVLHQLLLCSVMIRLHCKLANTFEGCRVHAGNKQLHCTRIRHWGGWAIALHIHIKSEWDNVQKMPGLHVFYQE